MPNRRAPALLFYLDNLCRGRSGRSVNFVDGVFDIFDCAGQRLDRFSHRIELIGPSVSNEPCRAWFLALRVRFADIDRDPDIAAPFARASDLADGPETIRRVAQRNGSQRGTSPVRSAASTPTGGVYGLVGLDRVREDGRVQALADNTRCAAVDQVPTMRFVPPSFQIGSGPNFEIPVGLFRPAPRFLAALEPRQVNERARELTRV